MLHEAPVPACQPAADHAITIPIIDLSDNDAAIVAAVAKACEQVGFFGIVGHQVPAPIIDRAFTAGRAFFARPREEKLRIARPAPDLSRGYNALAGQSLGLTLGAAAPPDLQESLGFGPMEAGAGPYWTEHPGPIHFYPNLWPASVPGFRDAVTAYWQAMEVLTARLNRIFAAALDLPAAFFADLSDRHATSMRINYYPAQSTAPEPGQLRAGAHSDYGAFTILRAETTPGGLQALCRDGQWIDVPKIPDGFVINIGDLLMRWTNDRFVSTVHRVVNPPEAVRQATDRMSIAYFFLPNHDADVTPLASCVTPQNPARHAPTTAGAYWRGKIVAARQIT